MLTTLNILNLQLLQYKSYLTVNIKILKQRNHLLRKVDRSSFLVYACAVVRHCHPRFSFDLCNF